MIHPSVAAANHRAALEAAMRRRMLEPEPWTRAELTAVATMAGGNERDADRYVQKFRRKGWATFQRKDGKILWRLTAVGRPQCTTLFGRRTDNDPS